MRSRSTQREIFINCCSILPDQVESRRHSTHYLTALFAWGYENVEDYVPEVAFGGREGRERVRVLRRLG